MQTVPADDAPVKDPNAGSALTLTITRRRAVRFSSLSPTDVLLPRHVVKNRAYHHLGEHSTPERSGTFF